MLVETIDGTSLLLWWMPVCLHFWRNFRLHVCWMSFGTRMIKNGYINFLISFNMYCRCSDQLDLTPQQTSRHQNTSLQSTKHHHHGTAEGSFTAKKWFGHRAGRSPCAHSIGKFFLWLIVFFLWNFRPRLVRALLVFPQHFGVAVHEQVRAKSLADEIAEIGSFTVTFRHAEVVSVGIWLAKIGHALKRTMVCFTDLNFIDDDDDDDDTYYTDTSDDLVSFQTGLLWCIFFCHSGICNFNPPVPPVPFTISHVSQEVCGKPSFSSFSILCRHDQRDSNLLGGENTKDPKKSVCYICFDEKKIMRRHQGVKFRKLTSL